MNEVTEKTAVAISTLFMLRRVSGHGLSSSRNSILIPTLKELEYADDKAY